MSNKVFKVRYKLIIENLQLKSGTMYLTDSNATKGIFQMRHFARFGAICTIQKTRYIPMEECY